MTRDLTALSPDIEDFFDEIEARTQFSDVLDLLFEWRSHSEREDGLPEPDHFEERLDGPTGANLMVLREVADDFRFERVGHAIPPLFGHNPQGQLLGTLPYRGSQAYMPRYRDCIATGRPVFSVQRKVVFGIPGSSERLLLPLSLPGGAAGLMVYVRSRADNYNLIRAVFDASQDGVLVVAAIRDAAGALLDFEVIAVNSAGAALVGGEPDQLIGNRLRDRFPKAIWDQAWPELLASLESGETRVFELDEPNKYMPGIYRVSSACLGDGLAITVSDLTQLHRAKQTLETQHATLVKVNAELRSEVVRRRRLEAELKQQAATDPLTGIANRRGFTDAMTVCFRADGGCPALILFDIDDFKAINDRYGHPVGDAVLKEISETVSGDLEDGALFGRLGGEEFAVFLPDASDDSACGVAERLRASIEAATCDHLDASVRVTASFGVASAVRADFGVDELITLADDALYCAKRGGRNRVECGMQTFAGIESCGSGAG